MRMLAGALLVVASAIFAAGYQVAQAVNPFAGGPLLFLAWGFGLIGIGLIGYVWFEETRGEKKP